MQAGQAAWDMLYAPQHQQYGPEPSIDTVDSVCAPRPIQALCLHGVVKHVGIRSSSPSYCHGPAERGIDQHAFASACRPFNALPRQGTEAARCRQTCDRRCHQSPQRSAATAPWLGCTPAAPRACPAALLLLPCRPTHLSLRPTHLSAASTPPAQHKRCNPSTGHGCSLCCRH